LIFSLAPHSIGRALAYMMEKTVGKEKPTRTQSTGQQLHDAAQAMAIPGFLVAGPLLGYFLGKWLGGVLFDAPRPGSLVGLLLGFAAGVRQTVLLVQRLGKD
jgi:F0F1-type ATP synthase assembly protein I